MSDVFTGGFVQRAAPVPAIAVWQKRHIAPLPGVAKKTHRVSSRNTKLDNPPQFIDISKYFSALLSADSGMFPA